MSRRDTIRRGAIPLLLGAAAWAGPVLGQAPPAPAPVPAPAAPAPAPAPPTTGAEKLYPEPEPGVQVVRLQPPAGARVDVLAPPTEPLPTDDPTVVGMRVGVSYQLRVKGLEGRPDVEVFPVVQVVGHLHRPPVVDPARFPIRVVFDRLDLEAALDHGRLVTQVVYLEDPEQALPVTLPKDEVPTATLTALEDPAKVAAALGRVMAIVRIGARTPGPEAMEAGPDGLLAMAPVACPFAGSDGGRCPLPCGPARGTAPPRDRTWLPRDEFLCDGGDRGEPMHFGGDGGLRGIDPRDAAIRFRDDRRPRVLPTNVVCIYSPRFAAVRTSVGPLQTETVQPLRGVDTLQRQVTSELLQGPHPLIANQPPVLLRHRSRASEAAVGVGPVAHAEFRVLGAYDSTTAAVPIAQVQRPEVFKNRQAPGKLRSKVPPLTIKTAEGAVVTGVVQGANQQVMAWKPQEVAGVEQPPNRPGLAVIKRVSAGIADAGDVVSFVIQYRNMGNVPISAVSVIDSLVPRLEYLTGSARGAAGTVFSADENTAGGTELRWDLPGALAPGQEGSVTFSARVR